MRYLSKKLSSYLSSNFLRIYNNTYFSYPLHSLLLLFPTTTPSYSLLSTLLFYLAFCYLLSLLLPF